MAKVWLLWRRETVQVPIRYRTLRAVVYKSPMDYDPDAPQYEQVWVDDCAVHETERLVGIYEENPLDGRGDLGDTYRAAEVEVKPGPRVYTGEGI